MCRAKIQPKQLDILLDRAYPQEVDWVACFGLTVQRLNQQAPLAE
jgi:hypothetical protein